jgi:hypothetical protein
MKNRTTTVFIALILVFFTLACTLPFYMAAAPESEVKIVYVEITSTPEEDADSDGDSEPDEGVTVTPPVPVNLDGPWTIWQGSAEQQLSIDFLQQGGDLTGNVATGGGHSLLFKGVFSQDGTSVTGTWESTTGTSGSFIMDLSESLSSFSGNLGGGVPFCGTRMGTSKPNPCLK